MEYKVFFRNGSTDFVTAKSAALARQKAEEDFGGKVTRVVAVEEDVDEDEDELEEDEEEEEADDE